MTHDTHSCNPPAPVPVYHNRRRSILELNPAEVGLASGAASSAWGILVETGYPESVVTLLCLADGTTSLYFSAGGGMLGSGQHRPVVQASQALVNRAAGYRGLLAPALDFHLPEVGQVKFTVLAKDGKWSACAAERALAGGRHPLCGLFNGAREMITQVHLLEVAGDKPAEAPLSHRERGRCEATAG